MTAPIFESERDGVRLYANRIEVEKRKMLGIEVRTFFLQDIAETRYRGNKAVTLVTKVRSAPSIEFRRKETAREFFEALNGAVGTPESYI